MTTKGLDQLHILHVYIFPSMDLISYIFYMSIYDPQWTGSVTYITCPYMDQLHFFIEISRSVGNIPKE